MVIFEGYYQPSGYSRPSGKVMAGERFLRLKNSEPDGGVNIPTSPGDSGRPVEVDSVARIVQFPANRKILDLEALFQYTVSDRLKALIELVEPHTHQFIRVDFVNKTGAKLEQRWFWQVCNRIDSLYGDERSGWHLDRGVWSGPQNESPIFDSKKIGSAHFWREKHYSCGIMMTETAVARFNENDISGFKLNEYQTHKGRGQVL